MKSDKGVRQVTIRRIVLTMLNVFIHEIVETHPIKSSIHLVSKLKNYYFIRKATVDHCGATYGLHVTIFEFDSRIIVENALK